MIGRSLSHFRITAKLGEGGMGEVYRAEDTQLGREVAIKVLPQAVASDPERLARFEREARVLAALDHANIAAIYGLEEAEGRKLLVMQLAEGETLAERLARGPVPVGEALPLALQIAAALEAAHEKGIVHRDLKPANVKVSQDGQVRVLDFGLAKALEPEPPANGAPLLTQSPTLTAQMTEAGVLLGTAAYMSPEQARGREADRRSDIWAFGVVLWEILTGSRLFHGETISDSLAAVLRAEPSWIDLPAATPASVRRLLRRCLEREPASRLQHIGDARLELDDAARGRGDAVAARTPRPASPRWRLTLPWLAAAAAALVAMFGWVGRGGDEPPSRATHLSLVGAGFHLQSNATISADGRQIAYTDFKPTFDSLLHVRSLDTGQTITFAGTEGARMPFFSPDGQWIAFFQTRTEKLVKVPANGGSATRLALVAAGVPTGSWGEDGRLVFSDGRRGDAQYEGLMIVSEDGRDQDVLTTPEPHEAHHQPFHLPGGRWLLFVVSGTDREDRIEALSLVDGSRRVVIEDAATPRFSSGQLLFYRPSSRQVLAVPMTLDPPEVLGTLQVVVSDVPAGSDGEGAFSASATGTIIYHPATGLFLDRFQRRIYAVSSAGEMEPLNVPPQDWTQPRVSPDGHSLLLRQAANPDCVLWLHDLDRGTTTRLTFDFDAHNPLWHPDGDRVTFESDDGELIGILATGIDGTRDRPERLVDRRSSPEAWSPDGRWLVYSVLGPHDQTDLWLLDNQTDEHREFLATRFNETSAAISPEARWIAYVSDESGRAEVYVRSFPAAESRVQVSSEGGTSPVWAPDASRLYYQQGSGIAMVRFDQDGGVPLGAPEPVFSSDLVSWARDTPYDLLPDGSLVVVEGDQESDRPAEMAIILDWASALDKVGPSS